MYSLVVRSARCNTSAIRPSIASIVKPCYTTQRYASIAYKPLPGKIAPETTKAVSHGTKTTSPHKKTFVNPPTSTLPPPLEIPEREAGQSTVGYYFKVGKSYWKFYKTALKAVISNHRASRTLVSQLRAKQSKGRSVSLEAAVQSGLLTRAEYQFILRSRRDIKRLPVLGVLLLVLGEYLPLIVIFLSGLVPRTAWIPKQTERSRTKIEKRREESFRNGTLQDDMSLLMLGKNQGIEGLNPSQILHVSRALGLHSTFWETFWDRPPQWLARSRTSKAINYLSTDDQAIDRDGGIKAMSTEELKLACEERGIDVLKDEISTLRKRLDLYLNLRLKNNIGIPALVLVRPSNWDKFDVAKK